MKKVYILCILALFLVQCSSYKVAEKNIVEGNFDSALNEMLEKKAKGVTDKKYTQWVGLLQKSYEKANAKDFATIERLLLENESVSKYHNLYLTYLKLNERQDKIQGLLPLYHNGKKVYLPTQSYSQPIQQYKNKWIDALAQDAQNKTNTHDKILARQAYENYVTIGNLNPAYPNLYNLQQQAYQKGLSHVLVKINNFSNTLIPKNLENALTDYSYFMQDQFWYQFYTNPNAQSNYDYSVALNFLSIQVSPETIERNNFHTEKSIVEGWEYAKNDQGQILKDSLGNKIKIDKHITVSADISELRQFKESFIDAEIVIKNPEKTIESFPLNSHFVFEDISSRVRGDERALEQEYLQQYKHNPLPMPTNEKMVYDCGLDLKSQLQYFMDRFF